MDWNDLQAFVLVADGASFSSAANVLHVTQPAVSKRIQNLEGRLGVPLFDRIGRRVRLTSAGELLLPRAKELLSARDDAERLVRNTQGEVSGVLKLATSHHVGLHRLAPVLRQFARQFPDVRLDIRFEDSEAAHSLVAEGFSELAVVTLDPEHLPVGPAAEPAVGPIETDLKRRILWRDPLVFVAEREFATDRPLTLADLAEQPAILPGLETYTGRIVRDRFLSAGFELKPEMSTNYLETIGMLVGIGLGWSVLPRTLLTDDIRELDVKTAPMARQLGSVIHPRRSLSNAASAFLATLESHADG